MQVRFRARANLPERESVLSHRHCLADMVDGHVALLPVTSPSSAIASYKYSLGVIAEKTGGSKWKMLVDMSASEYEEIVSACSAAGAAVSRRAGRAQLP